MRPYDSVAVRGVPVARVQGVHVVGTGAPLAWSSRTAVVDQLFNPDPTGELVIEVPPAAVDEVATVVAIDFSALD